VPLHTIVAIGDYRLVCRDDFPVRHAWLIAEALSNHQLSIKVTGNASDARFRFIRERRRISAGFHCLLRSRKRRWGRITGTPRKNERTVNPGR
jgi:hypothetical protein